MNMSVEDVLKAEIPEGKFKLALIKLQNYLFIANDEPGGFSAPAWERIESICAAFSALLALAKEKYALLSEVRRIAESKISVLPHSDSIPSDCDDVLIEILSAIDKLEAKP